MSAAPATVAGIEVSPDHWIGGERVSSAETFADISPIDEAHLADIARGGAERRTARSRPPARRSPRGPRSGPRAAPSISSASPT